MVSTKILRSTTVSFNIDDNKQITCILEWFLKDDVTLKPDVMTTEYSDLPS